MTLHKEQFMVEEFHKKIGATINHIPILISSELCKQRLSIILEEMEELKEAMQQRDLVSIADSLADLTYAILGTAVVYGINLKPIFDEVHRSNMTKGAPLTKDGKGVKGENYSQPNISKILTNLKKR